MSYELSGAQERKRNAEAKAREYYDRVRRQEQEMRDLQHQLADTEKHYADLQVQKAEMDSRMRQLATNMDATNRTVATLRSQVASKKQSIERDQLEMTKFQDDVVRLDHEIGELMKRRA